MRFIYINGQYLPAHAAKIDIQDRGYQFADSVYEVIAVHKGQLIGQEAHLKRLYASLEKIHITLNVSFFTFKKIIQTILQKNALYQGYIYCQVTRGTALRNHAPQTALQPVISVMSYIKALPVFEQIEKGINAYILPDMRWGRCDIKTTALLANILAKHQAGQKNAQEAWYVNQKDELTEGAASNIWVVTKNNILITPPADQQILNGITRQDVLKIAQQAGIDCQVKNINRSELATIKEAFITSATSYVMPVTYIDGQKIGTGKAGAVSLKLRALYIHHIENS